MPSEGVAESRGRIVADTERDVFHRKPGRSQQLRRNIHAPLRKIAERRLADQKGEATRKRRSRHPGASGVIASVQQDLGHEARRRSRLAASLLGTAGLVTDPAACHAWLPAPRDVADRLVSTAAGIGIKVTLPESVMVEREDRTTGIRLCLGGPSFDELTDALTALSGLLNNIHNKA
nr:hypothetical protein [Sphingomonas oleivorans]